MADLLPSGYEISCDLARLDLDVIHGFLAQSYWAKSIPKEIVERSVRNSLCFGVYQGAAQVGFARIVTDKATFAYLCDVFVLPEHRGHGLSKGAGRRDPGTPRSAGPAPVEPGHD